MPCSAVHEQRQRSTQPHASRDLSAGSSNQPIWPDRDSAKRAHPPEPPAVHPPARLEYVLHKGPAMHLSRLLPKLLALMLLSACIDLPEVEPNDPGGDVGIGTGGENPELAVRLVLPGDPTHVRGSVSIQVEVETDWPSPEKVELFAGEVLLAELHAPYSYEWDTTNFPEGTYSLIARAVQGELSATSQARQLTIDRTAPQVVSRTPAPEATLVPSGESIRIEFSEGMSAGTLSDGTVLLHINGSSIPKSLSLSEDGKVLTITPSSAITLPATAAVTLASGITDWAGNELEAAPLSWKWHVPTWLPVGASSGIPASSNASQPVLRLHPEAGPALAVLEASGPEDYGPGVYRWTGSTWKRLGGFLGVNVRDPYDQEYTRFYRPDLQIDASGTVVITWNEDGSSGNFTYLRRWTDDRWMEIPSPDAGRNETPSLQLISADNPWIATTVDDPQRSGFSVQVRWWNGQSWQDFGEALHALTTPSRIFEVSTALDRDGLPVIAWTEFEIADGNYKNGQIQVRRWTPAGWAALGGALRVNTSTPEPRQLMLQLTRNGAPVLAWSEPNTSVTKVKAADIHVWRWENGQWQPLGDYLSATTGETPATNPSMVLTESGDPVIAWRESDGSDNRVHVRRWTGDAWQTIEGAEGAIEASAGAGSPSLQLDESGRPWVAWTQSRGGLYVYRLNR